MNIMNDSINNINNMVTNDITNFDNYEMITQFSEEAFHDFKNILATISGLTQLTMLKAQSEETKLYLSRIKRATSDFTEALNNYYDFTTGLNNNKKGIHVLSEIVDEAISMVKHKFSDSDIINNRLVLNLNIQSKSKVYGYKYKLIQCFLNILTNAIDSMDKAEGILTVKVFNDSSNVFVNVVIIDTGSGISVENLERLFKERFTTKSNGTGLGLKIAKNCVEGHGGSLSITSKINEGTKVHILLPIYND